MCINLTETDLLHRLITAMRWISRHGVVNAEVADKGDRCLPAVFVLIKQGMLSFFSLPLFVVREAWAKFEVCMEAT
jgi:hypothetical protein